MPDNIDTQSATPATLPAAEKIATLKGTWSGDATAQVGPTVLFNATGAEGSWAFALVPFPTALGPVGGGLKVEDVGVATSLDTDDGSVAAAQTNIPLVIPLRYTWNGTAWVRGGWTPHAAISAASTNATSVKASAGVVGYISIGNVNAAECFFKLYNKASAPTVGTDTPVATFVVPGSVDGGGTNIPLPDNGMAFTTGIAYTITTGMAVANTGAVAANEVSVNLGTL